MPGPVPASGSVTCPEKVPPSGAAIVSSRVLTIRSAWHESRRTPGRNGCGSARCHPEFGRSPEVEGHLDGPGRLLVDEGGPCLAPVVEGEGVRQHAGQVDASRGGEIQVMGDSVLANAVDLLDAESVGADPADLLEVQRRELAAGPREQAQP